MSVRTVSSSSRWGARRCRKWRAPQSALELAGRCSIAKRLIFPNSGARTKHRSFVLVPTMSKLGGLSRKRAHRRHARSQAGEYPLDHAEGPVDRGELAASGALVAQTLDIAKSQGGPRGGAG